ncbi:MAG: hypothetical protein WC829_23720 [Hyphomicrobium sp.]|jgi:hypothetical protein
MNLIKVLLAVCLAMSAIGGRDIQAGELPAVSGPNGKLSVEGGSFDNEAAGIAQGSFAMPLSPWLGLQADGAVGSVDDEVLGGGGLHLFTRDPSSYLVGAYGSFHTWDSIDIWRIAGEAELYLGRVSLEGLAGYESVEVPSTVGGLEVLTPDDKHFFSEADIAYYITDDFKVYGGYRYVNETSLGAAGAEYLIRGSDVPLSLFARGDFGNEDYASVTGGLKVYLSGDPQKSLIDRHRMDDPQTYMPVFPKLVTKTATASTESNLCKVSGPAFVVTSPADGNCICPSNSLTPGVPPGAFGGSFVCSA